MSTVSIPAFHISDKTRVKGDGKIFIASRQDALSGGTFTVKADVQFDPAVDSYPIGNLSIETDMSDGAKTLFKSSSVELINSYGKHNPTAVLTGRCEAAASAGIKGARFWLMIANNSNGGVTGTPDIVGFAIHDRTGNRIAYGMGPLQAGNFDIDPK